MRWTRWGAVVVLAAFAIFDLCGRKAAPLPPEDVLRAAAAGADVVPFERLAEGDRGFPSGDGPFAGAPVADAIRALEGSRVAVAGYMLPTDVEGDRARRFLLCRWPGNCCFGGTIEPDDLVACDVAAADGAAIVTHLPVLVVGTFRVRSPTTRADVSASLYALEACEVRTLDAP